MKKPTYPSILFIGALIFQTLHVTNASTYELVYDGVFEPNTDSIKGKKEKTISELIAHKLSSKIAKDMNIIWNEYKEIDRESIIKPACRKRNTFRSVVESTLCEVDFAFRDMATDIIVKVRGDENGKYEANIKLTFTTRGDVPLQILKDAFMKVNKAMKKYDETIQPVWDIQHRPSSSEVLSLKEKVSIHFFPVSSEDRSSLETNVLSNSMLVEKELISKKKNLEVWQYRESVQQIEPTSSLFENSKLRYTSKFSGSAHAEAFVHPILISHPSPVRVALISEFPLAIVKEIFKHKNVKEVTIYDANKDSIDFFRDSFMYLDDCSGMGGRKPSCLQSVDLEGEFNAEKTTKSFDVVFIDVPSSPKKNAYYLSIDFMKDILSTLSKNDDDAAVVINTGSAPETGKSWKEKIDAHDYRGNFLRMATRKKQFGGLEVGTVHIYDEPDASPLDTTFILLSKHPTKSKTYGRFFRKNSAAIDFDIAEKMYKSSDLSYINTVLYDGPTHSIYTHPLRSWETWFCSKKPWKSMVVCSEFVTKIFDTSYHRGDSTTEMREDPTKGKTIYATEDIPKGSIIVPDDAANAIFFDDEHYENFKQFTIDVESAALFQEMFSTVDNYGYERSGNGFSGHLVTTTTNSFFNHGCSDEEINAGPMFALFMDEDGSESEYFSPVFTRKQEMYNIHTIALRDIKEGEEILIDYRYRYNNKTLAAVDEHICSSARVQ